MSALGSLVVKLALEYAQFSTGADDAKKRADELAKSVQGSMDNMADTVKAAAAGVAGGLAAAFTLGAVDQLLKDVTASQAALKDLSYMAGMTVEQLSGLQSVGRYVGLGAQEIAEASVSMTDALAQAKDESDGVGQALAAIGLKFDDFRRLRPDEQFQELARALSNYEDGAGKAAVMTQIMGEEGAKLLPFLRNLSSAGELQAKVTQEQADAAAEYQANLIATQAASDAWKQEIATGMVPALNLAVRAFDELIDGAGGLRDQTQTLSADGSIQQWTESAIIGLSYVADAADVAWRVLEMVGKNLGGLAAAIVQAVQGDFDGAWKTLQANGQDMIDVWGDPTIGARFRQNMADLKAAADKTTGSVQKQTLAVKNYGEEAAAAAERQKKLEKAAQEAHKAMLRELEAETAARVRAYEQEQKSEEALLKSYQTAAERAEEALRSAQDEEAAHARAAAQGITLAEAIAQIAVARAEDAYQQALNRGVDAETLLALYRELEARKQLVNVMQQRGVREANEKAGEQLAKDWEKTSQLIGDTLADYIMAGGKDGAQYLKRLFATLVLQPVVQTVVGGLMGTGVAGASGVASGGVGGVGGLVNSASNLYSMFNSPLLSTNIAAGLSSQIGTLGADLWMNGFESVGNSLIEFSSSIAGAASTINMIGNGLGYVSAIYSLSQGKYGSAIGAGIGTYVGGPIGAVIGSTLGGLVDGLFGGGTVHTGAAGVYTGGKVQASNASTARQPWIDVAYSPGMQASIDSVAGLIGGSLDAIATQLGKKSGYSVKIGYGADNDDPSFGAYNIVNPDGKKLAQYGWATKDFRFDSDPSKGYDQYLKSISQKTLSIMASEFGGWAGDISKSVSGTLGKLSGTEAVSALQTTAQQILTIVSGFKALGDQMSMFAGISTGVQTKLIKVSGSFDALASNAQSFYANYYSQQEQLDAAAGSLKEVFAKYGAALPATTEQYRALVERQMAAGEAGAEFAAVLLGLNGTFKQVADAWKAELGGMRESVSGVFDGLTQGISDLAADVASDRKSILRGSQVMGAAEIAAAIGSTTAAQAPALPAVVTKAYAVELSQWIDDALLSVDKLSDLRGEVMGFYEAQAQAVQTMLQSAGNLRSVVEQLRLGQLDSAQTAAELSSQYAANYSMALATSGSTRAGYVDAMAGSLPALTDALKAQAATGEDWRIQAAKLFAQATTAAGLLEGDAKTSDYQEVALGLLDSIDGALSALGSAAQSAQDLIVSAIEQGSASNLVGLRAVIAVLKGDPIPAFAAGGLHAGGLRIVGEHGPELEATGPARIWNASQTAAMLGGGSINMQRVERLLEQRNEEARAQASAIVRLQQDVNRLLMRWETQGMPEQRDVSLCAD